jgi:peptide deformylase
MRKIVQKDDPILRQTAKEVPISDIKKPKIQNLIADMFESLATQEDGVALAAPQVGESLRIFIITPKIFENPLLCSSSAKASKDKQGFEGQAKKEHLVFINPKIIKKSKDKKKMEEGCLSCRWYYGKTRRASRATIEALDENGEKFQMEGSGLIAQIFQHETDHFEGVLFIDHADSLKELGPNYE